MKIDNHHDDKVIVVWLRELCFLPYKEQLHWQSHNIPPKGHLSRNLFQSVTIKGDYLQTQIDQSLLFKQRYRYGLAATRVQKTSRLAAMLRRLNPRDEHHLKNLRVPSTE